MNDKPKKPVRLRCAAAPDRAAVSRFLSFSLSYHNTAAGVPGAAKFRGRGYSGCSITVNRLGSQ
jgi:hypothetical protein